MSEQHTDAVPALVPLVDPHTVKLSVTSTLDRTSSKRNLVDRNDDTCWTSASPKPGSPTAITLAFPAPGILPYVLDLTFQGGFVSRTVSIFISTTETTHEFILSTQVFPLDVNGKQSFGLPEEARGAPVHAMRLVLEDGSDLNYGRVTLYHLQILGLTPPG